MSNLPKNYDEKVSVAKPESFAERYLWYSWHLFYVHVGLFN